MWSACRCGIHRLDQLQVQLAHELHVAVHLFQHGIDDQRLAAAPGGDEIGVGAGNTVEKLSENHLSTPLLAWSSRTWAANCIGPISRS